MESEMNLPDIFTKTSIPIKELFKFNAFLRKLKDNEGINLMQSMIYLEEDHVKFKKIISLLDREILMHLK